MVAATNLVVLAVLFWPLPYPIDPVRNVETDAVSVETRLVFSAEENLTSWTATLLAKGDRRRGFARHFVHASLVARLTVFTSSEQRSAFVALNGYYGYGYDAFAAVTKACFGKRPAELALSEAAELAVRARSPASFAKAERSGDLRRQRDRLIHEMVEQGLVGANHAEAAIASALGKCS